MWLCSSLTLGSLQSPALEPSVSPHHPDDSPLQSTRALFHVLDPKQSAFFSHISPVRWSVTVPSPLSVHLGSGHATPLRKSPSSLFHKMLSATSWVLEQAHQADMDY